MVTWSMHQVQDFAEYQNVLPRLTEAELIVKFEKRTGIMADSATLDED